MAEEVVNIEWAGNMAFEAEVNDFKIMLDAEPRVGGNNGGPRPKPLTLVSLGGCTGMDVISILTKMIAKNALRYRSICHYG
jgi:putative redox protein